MVFRVKAVWRWLMLLVGVILSSIFFFVAASLVLHSDPQDRQTPGQKLATFAIFLAIAAALACAPWVVWTGRLWLHETGIKLRFRFRMKEVLREQIHNYAMQGGVRMLHIPIQPPSFALFGADNKVLMEIPGYFEGASDVRAWLDKVTASRGPAHRPEALR